MLCLESDTNKRERETEEKENEPPGLRRPNQPKSDRYVRGRPNKDSIYNKSCSPCKQRLHRRSARNLLVVWFSLFSSRYCFGLGVWHIEKEKQYIA